MLDDLAVARSYCPCPSFNVIASTGSKHRMKKIFIMEILCIYAKRRFFARYFEMYCHFIISGENEREECEVVEEEGERQKRERRKTFNQ